MPNTLVTEAFIAADFRERFKQFCETSEERNALEKTSKEIARKLLDLGLIHQNEAKQS